jgi:hypothetical protein
LLTPRAKAQNRVVRGALAILLVIFLMWKISSESSEATTQNASGSWRAQVLIQLPGPIRPGISARVIDPRSSKAIAAKRKKAAARHRRFLAGKKAHARARHRRYLREKKARTERRKARERAKRAAAQARRQVQPVAPQPPARIPAPSTSTQSTPRRSSTPAPSTKCKYKYCPDGAPKAPPPPPRPAPDKYPGSSSKSASALTGGVDSTLASVDTGGASAPNEG